MAVPTFINPVHEFLHKAYVKAGNVETAPKAGKSFGVNAHHMAVRGATLEEICEATGQSMDEVGRMLVQIKDHVAHRYDMKAMGAAAHKDVVRYGLRQHLQEHPEWTLGIHS